jgi:nitrile hydratase subunit beta
MNGLHDMGGLHNFGAVDVEANEPVFHQRWEGRVFALTTMLGRNIDQGRHAIECLDPVTYLRNGYYGRWLAALERSLLELGVIARAELDARTAAPPVRRAPRARGAKRNWRPRPAPVDRAVDRPAAFSVGQRVVTRNHQPPGHTRLPAYARCRRGTIHRVHAAMVFPDDHAHGRGENPQYVYTVVFAGDELWGPSAEAGTVVFLDLFESYLDADAGARNG